MYTNCYTAIALGPSGPPFDIFDGIELTDGGVQLGGAGPCRADSLTHWTPYEGARTEGGILYYLPDVYALLRLDVSLNPFASDPVAFYAAGLGHHLLRPLLAGDELILAAGRRGGSHDILFALDAPAVIAVQRPPFVHDDPPWIAIDYRSMTPRLVTGHYKDTLEAALLKDPVTTYYG